MNQILYNCDWNNERHINISKDFVSSSAVLRHQKPLITSKENKSTNSDRWYKIIFYVSLFFLIFFVALFLIRLYKNSKNEEISKKLTSSYSISTMYTNSDTNNYSTTYDENVPFVIRNN